MQKKLKTSIAIPHGKRKRAIFFLHILLMAVLLHSTTIIAQEYSAYIHNLPATPSKIKAVDDTTWIACIPYGNNKGFYRIVENSNTVQCLQIFSDTITDFDIDENYVHFCGKINLQGRKRGVLGRFSKKHAFLSQNSNVIYDTIKSFHSIDKILCANFKGQSWLFMATTDTNDVPNVAEYYSTYPHPQFEYGIIDSNYYINDLINTDSLIVASAYNKSHSHPFQESQIWMFKKSSSYGGNTLRVLGHKYYTVQSYGSKAYITHIDADKFAAVINSAVISQSPKLFFLNRYGCNVSMDIAIPIEKARYILSDIAYNSNSNEVDILMSYGSATFPPFFSYSNHAIIHIPTNIIELGSSLSGTLFSAYSATTIDYLAGNPDCFISAGKNTSNGNLQVTRYQSGGNHGCTSPLTTQYSITTTSILPQTLTIRHKHTFIRNLRISERNPKEYNKIVICE